MLLKFFFVVENHAEVKYVEAPSVKIDSKQGMVQVGDQVLVKCTSSGLPIPQTKWLWNGIDVKDIPDFEVCKDCHVSGFSPLVLRIMSLIGGLLVD